MIGDIVSILRFITDPDTRKTVEVLANIPSISRLDWKRNVKTASAKFSGNEFFKVSGFANALIADMKTSSLSENEIKKFETVFGELVRNAFRHGCNEAVDCKVSINCTYCPWFVALEISDTGRGFDTANALLQKDDDTHGLQLVKRIAFRLTTNKKGNSLTALMIAEPALQILPRVEKYRGAEILVLPVVDRYDWSYLIADWEPLRDAVKHAAQKLILVDCSQVHWSTEAIREMKHMVKEFKEYGDRFFALVVDHKADLWFDFSRLSVGNFKVFHDWSHIASEELPLAKEWLLNQSRSATSQHTLRDIALKCPNCGTGNRLNARYCNTCGKPLPRARA